MNYYLISDTHFNHLKIEEWGDRSGDWQGRIYRGLNNIDPEDTLIHLGDICIGNDMEVHDELGLYHFSKVLVKGNHDKKSNAWYQENGWDFVCDGMELVYMGEYLWLSHRPQDPAQLPGRVSRNVHGHTHGNMHRSEEYVSFYDPSFHVDISPEIVGYAPLRLETLIKGLKKKR